MVVREFATMAKKKTNPEETSAPPGAVRRRTPARKKAQEVTAPQAANGKPQPTQAEIAEAAYFRHLNRGGAHGDEFNDWVEAERELKDRR
jgi:hypothetical protein